MLVEKRPAGTGMRSEDMVKVTEVLIGLRYGVLDYFNSPSVSLA